MTTSNKKPLVAMHTFSCFSWNVSIRLQGGHRRTALQSFQAGSLAKDFQCSECFLLNAVVHRVSLCFLVDKLSEISYDDPHWIAPCDQSAFGLFEVVGRSFGREMPGRDYTRLCLANTCLAVQERS